MKLIPLISAGKTIWNFDESSLNDSFFIRKMWYAKGTKASVAAKAVSPNISVLLAVNNHGDAYICLSQSKTYSARVILFMDFFFRELDSI